LTEHGEHGELLFNEAVKIMSEPLPWLPEYPIAVEAKLMGALDE